MRHTHPNTCGPFTRNTLIPLLLLGSSLVASAETYTWNGGTTAWASGGNWSPTAPATGPISGDDIVINNLGGGSINMQNQNRAARDLTFSRTDSALVLGLSSNQTADRSLSLRTVTTSSGSNSLTFYSGGTSLNNRLSVGISQDLNVSSAFVLGRLDSSIGDFSSTIGDVSVSGTTTVNAGGSITLSRSISSTGSVGSVNLGALVMNGGALNLTGGAAAGSGSNTAIENVITVNSLNGSAGVIQANKASTQGSLVVSGGGSYGGTIIDNASGAVVRLTKSGTETLILSGANSYTGTTQVNSGTLLVNGNSAAATGAVTVAAGATLGGTGTLGGATTVSGIVAPGDGIGTLTIANSVTWNGGASASSATDWKFELGAGQTADLLSIQGNWLTGTGDVFRFDFSGSTALGTFAIVQWTGTTDFLASDFTYTNLGGGLTGEFNVSGNTLQVTVVPEPSTYMLLGLGLGAMILFRRRRLQ